MVIYFPAQVHGPEKGIRYLISYDFPDFGKF